MSVTGYPISLEMKNWATGRTHPATILFRRSHKYISSVLKGTKMYGKLLRVKKSRLSG